MSTLVIVPVFYCNIRINLILLQLYSLKIMTKYSDFILILTFFSYDYSQNIDFNLVLFFTFL